MAENGGIESDVNLAWQSAFSGPVVRVLRKRCIGNGFQAALVQITAPEQKPKSVQGGAAILCCPRNPQTRAQQCDTRAANREALHEHAKVSEEFSKDLLLGARVLSVEILASANRHEGQMKSTLQHARTEDGHAPTMALIEQISAEKGGASVLAGGFLLQGRLTRAQMAYLEYVGFGLQLIDDLQVSLN